MVADSPVKSRSAGSTVLFVMALLALALFDFGILLSRRYVADMFLDFGLKIGVITTLALSPITPVLLTAILLATLGKEWLPALRHISIAWNVAVLILCPVVFAFYLIGISEPLMRLIEGLSGP